jgi:hypothetical protein
VRRNHRGKISSRKEKNGEWNPAHVHGPRRESEQKPKIALSGSRNRTTEKHEDGEKNPDWAQDLLTGPKAKMKNTSDLSQKRNQKRETQQHTRDVKIGFSIATQSMITTNPWRSLSSLFHVIIRIRSSSWHTLSILRNMK